MHFLIDESPNRVFLPLVAAVMALATLCTVNATESNFTSLEQALVPVGNAYAQAEVISEVAWSGVTEAVYATAVYTGVIPEQESVYAAVDLPWHVRPLGDVAGSSVVQVQTTPAQALDSFLMLPWDALWSVLQGK